MSFIIATGLVMYIIEKTYQTSESHTEVVEKMINITITLMKVSIALRIILIFLTIVNN